jgi:hypothetical protein
VPVAVVRLAGRAPLWPILPSTDTRVVSVVLRVKVLRSTHNWPSSDGPGGTSTRSAESLPTSILRRFKLPTLAVIAQLRFKLVLVGCCSRLCPGHVHPMSPPPHSVAVATRIGGVQSCIRVRPGVCHTVAGPSPPSLRLLSAFAQTAAPGGRPLTLRLKWNFQKSRTQLKGR